LIARRLLPIAVILAGVAGLALLGDGWISRDRDARLADESRALREEAQALARSWQAMILGAADELREGQGDGRHAFLDRAGAVFPCEPAPPADPEIRRALERARAMGDRLAAAGDPLRAVDAYTLPLARAAEPHRCAPLLLAAARASLASGELAPWGRATLARLRDRPIPDALDPELGPVDLAAALSLPAEGAPPVTATDLLERLASAPVSAVAALAARFRERPGWVDDPTFDLALAERRRERDAILRHANELRAGKAALAGALLLLPLGTGAEGAIEIGVSELGAHLAHPADRYELLEGGSSPSAARADATDVARHPVLLDGETIATIALRDREAPARCASIERRATTLRIVLGGTLALVAGALLATGAALDRQRRLAELRVRLLANVSHELKTPVTSIRMLGELLQNPSLPRERVEEFGELITRESQRLGRRIEEILDTAWARENAAPLATSPVELRAVIDEVAGRFRARAEAGGGAIEVATAAARAPVVETNRDALERIVENLLDNAIKYGMRRGRSAAGAESPESAAGLRGARIGIDVAGEPGVARVVVEDDGPGVPAGEGERIFEPFYRAAFDDFAVPGTGLGLSISRTFAERLGGSLVHSPRPGGGSRFTLTLPCRVGG